MSDVKAKTISFIKKWEGGYAEIPGDKGGATNSGITLSTFQFYYGKTKTKLDLKKMTQSQWQYIFEKGFWNKIQCDKINDDSVKMIFCDWYWASGNYAVKHVQKLAGVTDDGVVGPKTLEAINKINGKEMFTKIKNDRVSFVNSIVEKNPSQKKFLKGWLNRINSIGYLN